jgi:polyvinyl alcohol dehydrogenase (cytochrome)
MPTAGKTERRMGDGSRWLEVMLPAAALSVALASSCTSTGADIKDLAPCEVAKILEQRCVECHGSRRQSGAPIALLHASDFRAQRKGQSVGALVLDRIGSATRPMPPKPRARLSTQQIKTLRAWVGDGANAAQGGCAVQEHHGDAGVREDSGVFPRTQSAASAPTQEALSRGEWPTFGADLTSSRANLKETLISPSNVGSLTRKWQFNGPSISGTPVILDGVLYVPGWDAKVYALSAADGSKVWTTDMPALIDSSLAVTAARVFVSDGHGAVHALDRNSGARQWSQPVDTHPQTHLWSSPIYIEDADLVVIGVASSEEVVVAGKVTFRGSVVALDAASGKERWRFYTTAADAAEGAGVAVWATVSVDTQRKVLYVGTGNNYGPPGSALSDSLLAIDYVQGNLLWHSQFLADDVFALSGGSGPDYDIGSTANLFTAGGKDLVGVGVKSGVYAAFERDSGTLAWMTQVSPGGIFGGLISAPAYASGMIFAASNDGDADQTIAAGIDAVSGKIAWQRALPMQTFSGVAYANQVVYVGTMSGAINALDATTGEPLWRDVMPDVAGSAAIAEGKVFVSFGYQLTLASGDPGSGGVVAYGLP